MNITHQTDNEKAFQVLELLSDNPRITQRALSEKSGMSLGLVNVILKRLTKTGTIKIKQLTGRKVRYILTPQGIAEKTKHSYIYFSRTFKVFIRQQERCLRMIQGLTDAGHTQFAILGSNEIASLVDLALKQLSKSVQFRHIPDIDQLGPSEVLLDCRYDGNPVESLGTSVLSKLLRNSASQSSNSAPYVSLVETVLGTAANHD